MPWRAFSVAVRAPMPMAPAVARPATRKAMVPARSRESVWLRSRNSRTVFEERPMAFAFLWEGRISLVRV